MYKNVHRLPGWCDQRECLPPGRRGLLRESVCALQGGRRNSPGYFLVMFDPGLFFICLFLLIRPVESMSCPVLTVPCRVDVPPCRAVSMSRRALPCRVDLTPHCVFFFSSLDDRRRTAERSGTASGEILQWFRGDGGKLRSTVPLTPGVPLVYQWSL